MLVHFILIALLLTTAVRSYLFREKPPLSALQDYGAPKFEEVHNPKCSRDPAAAHPRQHKRSRSQIAKVGGWRKSVPGTR